MDLYAENIVEHYKNPHHYGEIKKADADAFESNPLCGDQIKITLKIKNGVISDAQFQNSGCALSTASMSLLMDEIIGKKVADVKKLKSSDVQKLLGISVTAGRVKCTNLSLVVLKKAIENYEKENN